MFDEEEESEFDSEEYDLVKDIPMTSLTMLHEQGVGILQDIWQGEVSRSKGLPIIFYHTRKKQFLVEDGNHRIFERWLEGHDTFDALVYEGAYHEYLRPVYDGDEIFDWDEEYREE